MDHPKCFIPCLTMQRVRCSNNDTIAHGSTSLCSSPFDVQHMAAPSICQLMDPWLPSISSANALDLSCLPKQTIPTMHLVWNGALSSSSIHTTLGSEGWDQLVVGVKCALHISTSRRTRPWRAMRVHGRPWRWLRRCWCACRGGAGTWPPKERLCRGCDGHTWPRSARRHTN